MAGIQSTGIGSGLDVTSIVQQLVAAEGAPVEGNLARREAGVQAKLSAFGGLKSALGDLQAKAEAINSLDKILARKASSSDEDAFTVSVTNDASPARYDIEVVNVARAQKLTSGAFTNSTDAVGTGTLTIDVGGTSMSLEFVEGANTLNDIRDAINNATDNPGVSAGIVNADAGSYLILTGENTGLANTITVTQSGGDGGLSALEYDPGNSLLSLTETQAADDARIRVDGLDVQGATNVFADAIEGVTITALQDTGGQAKSLNVENDVAATKLLISNFVNSYNSLIDLNAALTSFDQDTGASGALIGDATLRGIISTVRREINTAVTDINGPFSLLNDIGIRLNVDGKFEIEADELDNALETDFTRVGQLFTNSDGFAIRIASTAESFLASDGILETRTDGLDSQIERINEQRDQLNNRLTSLEERLFRQYNALDSLLGELNNTSNFLNTQLQSLPGFTRPEK